jgi:alpha/beta superfamily hydrolase
MQESTRIAIPSLEHGPGIDLEGLWQRGAGPSAIVAPPHPLFGGRMDNPVVVALTQGLLSAGCGVLRFNFRGTGASQGVASDRAEIADADYRAALAAVRDLQPGACIAAGYSFGAATALRVAALEPDLARVVLVGPPVGMLDASALRACKAPIEVWIGDDDEYAPLPQLKAALAVQPSASVRVLAGVDHFFSTGGLTELEELARTLDH